MNDQDRSYRSGEICIESGCYRFKCYTDGSVDPLPDGAGRVIWLATGDVFPAIRGSDHAAATCLWVKVGPGAPANRDETGLGRDAALMLRAAN